MINQSTNNLPVSDPQMEFLTAEEKKVLFCGGIGSGKCIIEGTLVKTPTGSVAIQDLKIGDKVYGYNNDGSVSITTVTAVIDQGIKEVVDLVRYNQVLATCTKDHRWLVNTKQKRSVKRIHELNEGKDAIVKLTAKIPGGSKTVEHAYAIGALLGDGCSTMGGVVISSKDEHVVAKTAKTLGDFEYNKSEHNYSWRILVGGNRKYSKELYNEWIDGKKAHEKTCDIKEIRSWTRESQIEFISGLIDTDGSVYYTKGYTKRLVLQLGMQARPVIDTFKALLLDLFEVQVEVKEDSRPKYKNGPVFYVKVSNNHEVKKILKELKTVVDSKQYKAEYDELSEHKYKGDVYFHSKNERKAQCWDITVDNETHLYLLANGMVTHNTHAGALWVILMVHKYPGVTGLITANTHSQLRKATLFKLFELLEEFRIPYEYKKQESYLVINGTTVFAYAMQNTEVIRGITVGWCWSDECSFYDENGYNIISGRIRDKNGPCLWRGTTTPNGFNWLYERFVHSPVISSKVVYSKTSDNSNNVSKDYLLDLREQYDTKLAQQELDGAFVNLNSGKVFYSFDRDKHVRRIDDNFGMLLVGLDFNVHPLCGIYANIVGDKIYIFKELYQENSNTFKASKTIVNEFPGRLVNVICDETGNRRRSSSQNTDHEILRRAGLNVLQFKNPYIKDRDNNVNRLLEQNKIIIDPSCKVLIKNLEQLVHDNKDEMLGHVTDALGYVCWHLFPLHKPKRGPSVKYR